MQSNQCRIKVGVGPGTAQQAPTTFTCDGDSVTTPQSTQWRNAKLFAFLLGGPTC